jgi:RHS repeat-associated protein
VDRVRCVTRVSLAPDAAAAADPERPALTMWQLRSGLTAGRLASRRVRCAPHSGAVRHAERALVVCAAVAVLVPAVAAMRPVPPGGGATAPAPPRTKPVPAHVVHSRPLRVRRVPDWRRPPVVWPAAGARTVVLRTAGQRAARPVRRRGAAGHVALAAPSPGSVRAGSLPVWIGPVTAPARRAGRPAGTGVPTRVRVVMAPRRAAAALGVSGVVFSVAGPAAGAVHVSLGYGGFAYADAGGFAARLQLVALPGCALTSPRIAACRRMTPLGSANNLFDDRLGVNVTLLAGRPAVLAATTSPSGSAGDYSATPLSEAGTWAEGGSSGAFTYSYPITVPPVPGGLAPQMNLDYNSQQVDGLTSSTNNQASWIGDGWDYEPGYIERDYQSCEQNPAGPTQTGDLCWSSKDTTTLSLGGVTTTLVDDPTTGWHAEADNGDQISYVTGSGNNGTHDDDYWVVTDPDGTSYYFGLNQLPGYSSGNTTTNSAWTVPVYAPTSGQPCYHSDFSNSHCMQAWRWNLDYVTDSHGDAEAFFYNTETNYYAADSTASDPNTTATASYIQGGALSKIEYGLRAGGVYGVNPAAEVDFTAPEDRTDIPTSNAYGGDLACSSGDPCDVISPTFWSKYDLTTIETKTLEGSSLQPVDSWTLAKSYPDPHDSTSTPSLWLSSITRTGEDGTSITLPPVTFSPVPKPNRVETQQDLTDGYSIITRMRIGEIINETGGITNITYDTPPASCTSGNFPAEDDNSTLCYPDYWLPPGSTKPFEDWFNKYVVTIVAQSNTSGGTTPVVTNYSYAGAAWHYDDDTLTRSKYRTWDQWRGFGTVTTETGTSPDPVTETVDTYFQGMDGDYQSGGGTSSASLTSTLGDETVTDSDQFAGMDFEHTIYDGAGGGVVTDTVTVPWTSPATATQSQPSPLPSLQAFMTGTAETKTFTTLAAGGYREADDTYTHDSDGRVMVEAKVPDTTDASEDTCTQTSYAAPSSSNPDSYMTDLPAEVIITSVDPADCPVSGTPTKAELVSDTRTYYDGSTTLGTVPGAGDATMTQLATSYSSGAEVFTTESQATYDEYGRTISATDADDNTTTTSYTPSAGAEPTSVTVTDPMGLATTTTYDPARDLPLTVRTPAGYVSTEQYDSLGRLTAAWNPRNPVGGPANDTFSYTVSNTQPSVVTTNTLNVNGDYFSSDTLYDSLGRQIETQSQTSDGSGMDVSDTFYNSDGWPVTVSNPYYVQFNPSASPPIVLGALVDSPAGAVPSQTQYTYDGDGRVTVDAALAKGEETWETDTSYGGDYTTVTPPAGGTAETTYTDGNGQTSYVYQYHAATPPASPPVPGTLSQSGKSGWDETAYTYSPAQQLSGINDAAQNQWSYSYNLAGDQTSATDPDSGTTVSKYDANGNLLHVTDARGDTISYTYDADNRKIAEYDTTGGAAETGSDQLAAWTYDTLAPGLLTSSTAYGPGGTSGTSYTEAVKGYGEWGLPTGDTVSISAGPLAGTYTQTFGYSADTQQENSYTDYAVPGLPQEKVTVGIDNLDRPAGVTGTGADVLLTYNELSQPEQYSMGPGAMTVYDTYYPETGLLQGSDVTAGPSEQTIADTTYGYDDAGLVTSEADTPANGPAQVQCFEYDYLGRLTTAWSQGTAGCSGGPSQTAEAGAAAPYWDAYQYSTVNNLTSVTSTPPAGGATTTTSTFPPAGSAQPHAVSLQQTNGPGYSLSTSHTYDAAGDTTAIATPSAGQKLSWNDAGQLSSVTGTGLNSGTTSYVYDADGNLLLREGPSSTTLFLPDEEITQTGSTTVGTRYYSIGGVTVAAMSDGTINYLTGDPQGTDTIAVNSSDPANPTYRYYDPYGNPVGPAPSAWLGVRGFVGGDADTVTGFTNLGAREYNPGTSSFLSPDPLVNPGDPQDLNAYAYGGDSPAAFSDPSGMYLTGSGSGCGYLTSCSGGGGSGGGGSGSGGSGSGGGGWGNSGGRTDPWAYGPPGDVHTALFETPPVQIVRTPRAVTPTQASIGLAGCTGIVFRLGACPSERAAAGSTPQEVQQSFYGALGVLLSAVPLGDLLDAITGVFGKAAEADATTAALQEHLAGAVARFNAEGLTEAQKAALVDNPGLKAAFQGQRIDTFFKESLNNAIESGSDPRLANLYVTRSGEFGPDVFDLGSMNRWWDVTTEGSWAAHVTRYAGFPGTGIPLFTP